MQIGKLLNPSERNGRAILLGFAVILFIVCIKYLNIDYEDNDDYVYSRIISGSYSGTPSAMTVYEGYVFGMAVSWLYRAMPNYTEWYILIFHVLYILSYIVIARKLLTSNIPNIAKYFSCTAFTFGQLYLLICPQFTILAGELALAAGVSLIGKPTIKDYIIAVFLIFFSSQIRIQSLLMVMAPMVPLLFIPIKLKQKKYWIKPIVLFVSIIAALYINTVSNQVYYQDEDWIYFSEYNKPRGVIEQSLCKYKGLDLLNDTILRAEYMNLCNSRLIDGKSIPIKEMNECAKYVQSMPLSFFRMNALPYLNIFNQQGFFLVGIWITGLLIYACRIKDWKYIWIILCSGAIFLIELIYCMTTSFAKERLVICFMMYLFAIAGYCTYRILKDKHITACILSVSVIFGLFYIAKSYIREHNVNNRLESTESINKIIASIPYNKVFIIGIPIYAEAYHVSTTPITDKLICKGWLNNIPLHKAYYSGYESLLDKVPIVISHQAKDNIADIEYALKHKGIEIYKEYLYNGDDYDVVLLRKFNRQ